LRTRLSTVLHFGEQPVSFRQYLKRYSSTSVVNGSTFAETVVALPLFATPLAPVGTGSTTSTRMILFDYLRYAYLGMRGGVRKRIRIKGPTDSTSMRVQVSIAEPSQTLTPSAMTSAIGALAFASTMGMGMFVPFTNAGIEVEVPFYNDNLFIPSGLTAAEMAALTFAEWRLFNFNMYNITFDMLNTPANATLVEDTAISEDFNFLRFQGAPFIRL